MTDPPTQPYTSRQWGNYNFPHVAKIKFTPSIRSKWADAAPMIDAVMRNTEERDQRRRSRAERIFRSQSQLWLARLCLIVSVIALLIGFARLREINRPKRGCQVISKRRASTYFFSIYIIIHVCQQSVFIALLCLLASNEMTWMQIFFFHTWLIDNQQSVHFKDFAACILFPPSCFDLSLRLRCNLARNLGSDIYTIF